MTTDDLYEPAMLANPLEVGLPKHANQWDRAQHWMFEPKLDGIRTCMVKDHDNKVWFFSRTRHDQTAKLPVELLVCMDALPAGTVLDGELGYHITDRKYIHDIWPIIDFNATTRVLGSSVDAAQEKLHENKDRRLIFWAFDVLWLNGRPFKNGRNQLRRVALDTLDAVVNSFYFEVVPWAIGWREDAYTSYVNLGGEGVMLKNPNAFYYPGSRVTQVWYKVKKFETIDVKVTGFIEGKGKYEGQIGAITFITPQGVEAKCSGMTDDARAEFSIRASKMIGKTMEIRYFGNVGKGGQGIRHPQFIRMREDKDE